MELGQKIILQIFSLKVRFATFVIRIIQQHVELRSYYSYNSTVIQHLKLKLINRGAKYFLLPCP